MANIMANVGGGRGAGTAATEGEEPGSLVGEESAAAALAAAATTTTTTTRKSVKAWNLDDVCGWLDRLDLAEHKETFKLHDIRGAELLQLDRRDLKELEIKKLGHVKRILQGIKDLKTAEKSSAGGHGK